MSGGSYDYLYYKIEDAARRLMRNGEQDYRRSFGQLLMLCSSAMHDVEWVDSGDMSEGDDKESIMKCITPKDILNCSIERAEHLIEEMQTLIKAHRENLPLKNLKNKKL